MKIMKATFISFDILSFQQSQVPCYPERKIQEFSSNIDHLQGLYKAFIRKLKGLDPQLTSIPWNDRVYQSRKRHCNEEASQSDDIIHQGKGDNPTQTIQIHVQFTIPKAV